MVVASFSKDLYRRLQTTIEEFPVYLLDTSIHLDQDYGWRLPFNVYAYFVVGKIYPSILGSEDNVVKRKLTTAEDIFKMNGHSDFNEYLDEFYLINDKYSRGNILRYSMESRKDYLQRLIRKHPLGCYTIAPVINNLANHGIEQFHADLEMLSSGLLHYWHDLPWQVYPPDCGFEQAIEDGYDAMNENRSSEMEDYGLDEVRRMDIETDGFWRIENDHG